MQKLSSWGRLSNEPHNVVELGQALPLNAQISGRQKAIAFGMGRSYGDVNLNPQGTVWRTTGLDRLIAFNEESGLLECQAGVLLRDIQRLFIPRGWSLPVTPGTQMVTVGGAIANDIHGKNHYRYGCFGDHVRALTLVRTTGETIQCGPASEPNWFYATVGGLGLTGLIASAQIQLKKTLGPWLNTETIPYGSLPDFFKIAGESEKSWEHSVSWIDCLSGQNSRGIFLRANVTGDESTNRPTRAKTLTMPVVPPMSMVNSLTLKPFNALYFNINQFKAGQRRAHYESFFYPLDNISHWNRMYGPKGFYQYQSVIPTASGEQATKDMLQVISQSGQGSFLAVLKTFSERQSVGMLSFAQPGVTLALDFPNLGDKTLRLFDSLDAIVRQAQGRIYAAKDARMPRALFEAGYPRLQEFSAFRDPGMSSALSRRLMGS